MPSANVHISEGILNIFHENNFSESTAPLVEPLCCILVIFGNLSAITLIFPTVLSGDGHDVKLLAPYHLLGNPNMGTCRLHQ